MVVPILGPDENPNTQTASPSAIKISPIQTQYNDRMKNKKGIMGQTNSDMIENIAGYKNKQKKKFHF
jgi:hypothetical protein